MVRAGESSHLGGQLQIVQVQELTNCFRVPVTLYSASVDDPRFSIHHFEAGVTIQPNATYTVRRRGICQGKENFNRPFFCMEGSFCPISRSSRFDDFAVDSVFAEQRRQGVCRADLDFSWSVESWSA